MRELLYLLVIDLIFGKKYFKYIKGDNYLLSPQAVDKQLSTAFF